MQTLSERVDRDLHIMSAMLEDMGAYLDSDVRFWPLSQADLPSLTLGGYLLREQRLLAMRDRIATGQAGQLNALAAAFDRVLAERIIRFEKKAHGELQARLRQWEEYLRDVDRGAADRSSNYATAVEARVMAAALAERLSLPPYAIDPKTKATLTALDDRLRDVFVRGSFVWSADWQPAYPADRYWYLYGTPHQGENRAG